MISALIMFFNVGCLQKRLIITASPCIGVLNMFGNSSIMILKLSISGAISGFDYFKTPKNYNETLLYCNVDANTNSCDRTCDSYYNRRVQSKI